MARFNRRQRAQIRAALNPLVEARIAHLRSTDPEVQEYLLKQILAEAIKIADEIILSEV